MRTLDTTNWELSAVNNRGDCGEQMESGDDDQLLPDASGVAGAVMPDYPTYKGSVITDVRRVAFLPVGDGTETASV